MGRAWGVQGIGGRLVGWKTTCKKVQRVAMEGVRRRNAYHRLQPRRPSDPYLWPPSDIAAVYSTHFTLRFHDTEFTLDFLEEEV